MVLFGPSIARLAPLREKRWLDAFARRYQRFLLQGMGRRVLSRQARGQGHARALRDAIADRRDQQHVLLVGERESSKLFRYVPVYVFKRGVFVIELADPFL